MYQIKAPWCGRGVNALDQKVKKASKDQMGASGEGKEGEKKQETRADPSTHLSRPLARSLAERVAGWPAELTDSRATDDE